MMITSRQKRNTPTCAEQRANSKWVPYEVSTALAGPTASGPARGEPLVQAAVNFTNNSPSTQTFVVYNPLSLSGSFEPGTVMSGSISALVIDADFSGDATLAATPTAPVYSAYIDPSGASLGSFAHSLWQPSFSLSTHDLGGNADQTTTFSGIIGPKAMHTIGLQLRFTLSPGDSASITATFQIRRGYPGDVTGDTNVNVDDLLKVIQSWGQCAPLINVPCEGDVNGDGFANIDDLLMVINNWS